MTRKPLSSCLCLFLFVSFSPFPLLPLLPPIPISFSQRHNKIMELKTPLKMERNFSIQTHIMQVIQEEGMRRGPCLDLLSSHDSGKIKAKWNTKKKSFPLEWTCLLMGLICICKSEWWALQLPTLEHWGVPQSTRLLTPHCWGLIHCMGRGSTNGRE